MALNHSSEVHCYSGEQKQNLDFLGNSFLVFHEIIYKPLALWANLVTTKLFFFSYFCEKIGLGDVSSVLHYITVQEQTQ